VSGPDCFVQVFYGHERNLTANGRWKVGRVPAWFGQLEANLTGLLYDQNVSVATDGRLHLLSTVSVQVPATVPDLPNQADTTNQNFVPAPGPNPTVAQCAGAWNATAPPPALIWIGGLRPYGALIQIINDIVNQTVITASGSTTVSISGPACDIRVLFGYEQYVGVIGVWKDGGVSAWTGDFRSNMPLIQSGENASVAANGTLYLH
jgi:hypothetical protein